MRFRLLPMFSLVLDYDIQRMHRLQKGLFSVVQQVSDGLSALSFAKLIDRFLFSFQSELFELWFKIRVTNKVVRSWDRVLRIKERLALWNPLFIDWKLNKLLLLRRRSSHLKLVRFVERFPITLLRLIVLVFVKFQLLRLKIVLAVVPWLSLYRLVPQPKVHLQGRCVDLDWPILRKDISLVWLVKYLRLQIAVFWQTRWPGYQLTLLGKIILVIKN